MSVSSPPSDCNGSLPGQGDSIIWLIQSIHGQIRAKINQRMKAISLTDAQWGLVLQLAKNGSSTASDLSRICMRNSSGMTRALDRLEAKRIVSRTRSHDDRRIINLELTEKGRLIASAVPTIVREINTQMLTEFQPEEAGQFREYLHRILATMDDGVH